jgi:hypothetical protein
MIFAMSRFLDLETKQKVLRRESAVAGASWRNHPCIGSGIGITYSGAVVWTQFYSKRACREAWCPIRHSPWTAMMGRGFLSARGRIPSWLKFLGNCVVGVLQRAGNRTEPLGPVSWASMINTCRLGTGASGGWKVIQSFITKSGCQWSALVATSSSASGISRRKITHTSTSISATPAKLSAPIALRYSVSIRPWVHAKLIR